MKRLSKKQVRALRRRFKRFGESDLRVGMCRIVNNRRVEICRDSTGYYMAGNPHSRAIVQGASRSRRLSPYYHDE